jgi:hypothetical protein
MTMAGQPVLSSEQLRDLLGSIKDATVELQIQRQRVLERLGPTAAEALDLGSSIDRLQRQARILEPLVSPAAEPTESVTSSSQESTSISATPMAPETHPVDTGWEVDAPQVRKQLRQYYIYYWTGISRDQLNIWVFYSDTRPPTRQEASDLLEKAIKRLGGGYWQMVQDWTVPPENGVLYREEELIAWGWETGLQKQPEKLQPGEALVRKLKIEDWQENPEPHQPKEIKVPIEELRGKA